MTDPNAGSGQVAVGGIPVEREIIVRQSGEVQAYVLLVMLELVLTGHLAKYTGSRQYLHATQQAQAQPP